MSGISISPYFPFCRIKIAKQAANDAPTKTLIVVPDQRIEQICHRPYLIAGLIVWAASPIRRGCLMLRQKSTFDLELIYPIRLSKHWSLPQPTEGTPWI
jgi:hypothetical protein